VSKRKQSLAGARLETDHERQVVVVVGKRRSVVPGLRLRKRQSVQGAVFVPGEVTWDEVALYLSPDGQLLVQHVAWLDSQYAGKSPEATRWLASGDGRRWESVDAPPRPGRRLGRTGS
jgi:hypothetical protein